MQRSNGNFLTNMFGPYGGTKESEFLRPLRMGMAAIVIAAVMLLLLIAAAMLCGEFVGPVIVLVTSLLQRRRNNVPLMQTKIFEYVYWIGAFVTVATIYLGGFPIGWEVGDGKLWMWIDGQCSFVLPLWVDTFRWWLVAVIGVAEFVLVLVESRLLTEILFPSLPNSVRATQGFLHRLFPFMRIKNTFHNEEAEVNDGIFPDFSDSAPMR